MLVVNREMLDNIVVSKLKANDKLDFCDFNKLLQKPASLELWLTKQISSIANVNGGLIIFGIQTKNNRAYGFEEHDLSLVDKNVLQLILESEIKPKIEAEISYIYSDVEKRKGIIVINIPYQNNKPFMASDSRYYYRVNAKCELLPEERIREMYLSSISTNIEFVGIVNTNGIPIFEKGDCKSISFYPKFLIRNDGNKVEEQIKCELYIPTALVDENFIALNNYFNRYEKCYNIYSIQLKQSLFQNEIYNVVESKILLNEGNISLFEKEKIKFNIFYSNGIKNYEFYLKETFTYEKKQINSSYFTNIKQINI